MKASDAVLALGALAQETRLGAFRALVQAGPEGLPAGAIAEKLSVPPSSLTFHLQQLVHAGLITQRRASRQIIYTADFARMNALMGYLSEKCCGGGSFTVTCEPPALAAPARQKRRARG